MVVNSSSSLCCVVAGNPYGDLASGQFRRLQVRVHSSSPYLYLTVWMCAFRVRAHPRVLAWMSEHMPMPELPYLPQDEIDEELEYWQDML